MRTEPTECECGLPVANGADQCWDCIADDVWAEMQEGAEYIGDMLAMAEREAEDRT